MQNDPKASEPFEREADIVAEILRDPQLFADGRTDGRKVIADPAHGWNSTRRGYDAAA